MTQDGRVSCERWSPLHDRDVATFELVEIDMSGAVRQQILRKGRQLRGNMLEMAEAGGDCYPLGRETFPIAQMKRESGSGTFERSDSLVLQIGCKSLLEGQAICTKLFDANRGPKIGVFNVVLFAIVPKVKSPPGS
jgi:hypothetical protein